MSKRSRPVKTPALRSQSVASSAPPLTANAAIMSVTPRRCARSIGMRPIVEDHRRIDHEAGRVAAGVLDADANRSPLVTVSSDEGLGLQPVAVDRAGGRRDRAVPLRDEIAEPDDVGVEVDAVAAAVVGQGDVGARDVDAAEGDRCSSRWLRIAAAGDARPRAVSATITEIGAQHSGLGANQREAETCPRVRGLAQAPPWLDGTGPFPLWRRHNQEQTTSRCGEFSPPRDYCERTIEMARRCELTGKGVMTGNTVSHALNRTRRRFLPEPAPRDADLGRARPLREAPHLGQRAALGRASRRSRCLPAQGQGRRAVASTPRRSRRNSAPALAA